MVDLAHGAAGAWVSIGLQGFFVLCVWRLARRLHPMIDAIKDLDAGRAMAAVSADQGDEPIVCESATA